MVAVLSEDFPLVLGGYPQEVHNQEVVDPSIPVEDRLSSLGAGLAALQEEV